MIRVGKLIPWTLLITGGLISAITSSPIIELLSAYMVFVAFVLLCLSTLAMLYEIMGGGKLR